MLEARHQFCTSCGRKIDWEEVFIRHYFKFGYHYEVIIVFPNKFYDIKISLRTLKYELKSFGLTRKLTPFYKATV